MSLTFNPLTGNFDVTGGSPSTGIAIGAPVVGGTDKAILFVHPDATLAQSAALTWDETQHVLVIGANSASDNTILQVSAANENQWFFSILNRTWSTDPTEGFVGLQYNDGSVGIYAPADFLISANGDGGGGVLTLSGSQVFVDSPVMRLGSQDTGAPVTSHPADAQVRTSLITAVTGGSASDLYMSTHYTQIFGQGGAAQKGTMLGNNVDLTVAGSGDTANEYAYFLGGVNAKIGTGFTQTMGPVGNLWGIDSAIQGPIAVQPGFITGISQVVNNFYNGSGSAAGNAGVWIITDRTKGGNTDPTHDAANTYPMDVGLGIVGTSTAGASSVGFTTGIQIGGAGGGGWDVLTSVVGTGLHIRDYTTAGILIDNPSGSPTYDIEAVGNSYFHGDVKAASFTAGAAAVLVSGGALGTPSSGTLTNCTGLPVGSVTGLGTGVATWLGTPSSANLLSALTTKTGSGVAVFGTSPTVSGATLTGSTDASGASALLVPTSGGAAPTTGGSLAYDSTQHCWSAGDGLTTGHPALALSAQQGTSDTLTASVITTNETAFATVYTLKANTLIANKMIRVSASFTAVTGGTAQTIVLRLRAGDVSTGTVLWSSPATAPAGINTTTGVGRIWLISGTAAAGSSVNVLTGGLGADQMTNGNRTTQPVAIATNADKALTLTVQYNGSGATNAITLNQLLVEELN